MTRWIAASVALVAVSAVAQQATRAPTELVYGQLVILGVLAVVLVSVVAIAESRVRRIVQAELNDPTSALGLHKDDPSAHERMRDAMFDKLDERLGSIERSIIDQRKEARDDFRAFQRDVLQPIASQSRSAHALLERAMDRERRFSDPETEREG